MLLFVKSGGLYGAFQSALNWKVFAKAGSQNLLATSKYYYWVIWAKDSAESQKGEVFAVPASLSCLHFAGLISGEAANIMDKNNTYAPGRTFDGLCIL